MKQRGIEFTHVQRPEIQSDHVKVMNTFRDIKYPDGEWINKKGAPTAKEKVCEYRLLHPEATVTEVARALGISRTTAYKWWNGDPVTR